MPWGLKRFQQTRDVHFLTFSCYKRRPNFRTPESRSTFEAALERVRQQYELCMLRVRRDARACASTDKRTRARHAGTGDAVAETGSCAKAGSTSCGFVLAGAVLRLQCLG